MAKRQDLMPYDDEEEDDFMERCVDELGDEEVCTLIWENASVDGADIKHKLHANEGQGMEFVLSDETPDRLDDVIMSEGWDLRNFKRNPIALFNHNSNFPIGKWADLRIENKQLRGTLEAAPEGTSERIDEIRRLMQAGILRAVSVGFKPKKFKDREGSDWGTVFEEQELIETSLVSVPANPNALAVAKNLKISPETLSMVFAGQGEKDRTVRRGFTGGHAKPNGKHRGKPMSGLSQRIQELQTQIVAQKDALTAHLEKMDNDNVTNQDLEILGNLNADIARLEKVYESLIDSEKILKTTADDGGPVPRSRSLVVPGPVPDPNAPPRRPRQGERRNTEEPPDVLDLFIKAGTLAYCAKAWNITPDIARQRIIGTNPTYDDDEVKVVADIVLRAASAPAMTTVAGWAMELAHTVYADLMPLLMPQAILTRLATRGLPLSFGQAGRIVIPTRSRTPSLAGSFVGEGMAIPVRQGAFTSQTLTPKKMAVITTWTREMDEHSIPAIEGILRDAIQVDTSVAIDTVLLDSNPATVIRPAGLLNGVAATTPTAGGGLAAFIGDLTALISAIATNTYGNVRNPVWLANPTDMLRASLLQATNTGIFPFRAEIAAGSLNTIPIIDSATVPAKTLVLVDAADFVVVGGDAPRMEMSDQATLHMEDTNPTDLVASPSTVAAPQRSLFQTDSLALRMILPLNWLQRRAGTVSYVTGVTW